MKFLPDEEMLFDRRAKKLKLLETGGKFEQLKEPIVQICLLLHTKKRFLISIYCGYSPINASNSRLVVSHVSKSTSCCASFSSSCF